MKLMQIPTVAPITIFNNSPIITD